MIEFENPPDFPEGAAIIYGGSGGLGQSIARLLHTRGANVAVTYRSRKADAEAVVAQIAERDAIYAKLKAENDEGWRRLEEAEAKLSKGNRSSYLALFKRIAKNVMNFDIEGSEVPTFDSEILIRHLFNEDWQAHSADLKWAYKYDTARSFVKKHWKAKGWALKGGPAKASKADASSEG